MMAKAGGGASGVLKGIGALTAAGDACHCVNVLKLARMQFGCASTISCGSSQTLTRPIQPAPSFCDLLVKSCEVAAAPIVPHWGM